MGTGDSKIELGQFYTKTNPFTHPRVRKWLREISHSELWLEPFAGAGNIVSMIDSTIGERNWTCYDIAPGAEYVEERDVLKSFPTGFDIVITNPPYLAKNSARRKGYGAALEAMKPWDDLYMKCIDTCLSNVPHVAAIIPESFIVSGALRERLRFVVSLNQDMFADTEHPVCLAVFGPRRTKDFTVWVGERRIGTWTEIGRLGSLPEVNGRYHFNDPRGRIGLQAVDNTVEASIAFMPGRNIPASEIKHSSRHRTRIKVPELQGTDTETLGRIIATANEKMDKWRRDTGDVLMSPFMGLRSDGVYRRRLDYATASRLLQAAILDVVGDGAGAKTRQRAVTDRARSRSRRTIEAMHKDRAT